METLHPEYLPEQMWLLVQEQSFLWEFKDEMVEFAKPDRNYRAGPWPQSDCLAVLLAWFDAGWLDLVAHAGGVTVGSNEWVENVWDTNWISGATRSEKHYWTLASNDARELLLDPSQWDVEGAGLGVIACNSMAARDRAREEWIGLLGDTAKGTNGV